MRSFAFHDVSLFRVGGGPISVVYLCDQVPCQIRGPEYFYQMMIGNCLKGQFFLFPYSFFQFHAVVNVGGEIAS